jgi:hypothetical protein
VTTLATVGSYILEARRILQDEVQPYRYPDADLVSALNIALMEARRLRPDLFLGQFDPLPHVAANADPVPIDPMYRPTFLYYVVGMTELRDSEDTKDARAVTMLNKFLGQLMTARA